ncbi:MAG TPA: methyltransferase domain-containing protein [Stellaceae bacterium]|nr:methyltransferase domain-containing protein [Stellaceae bacterium]
MDLLVTTWTLCSIPDADRALREMHRGLKPAGRLLGRLSAPALGVQPWPDCAGLLRCSSEHV